MRESYFWHKVHSLTGIIPIGFYMVQHLTLNSFSLAGPEKFNSIIHFFEGIPVHLLVALKLVAIYIPLIFHAVYGLFITSRGQQNYSNPAYKFRENRYFLMQRVTGIIAFFFLIYHVSSTSMLALVQGSAVIEYGTWAARLASGGTYIVLAIYMIGVLSASYHLTYGIWNFCIRWGITISERSQMAMAKFSFGAFVALTGLGWVALFGFFNPIFQDSGHEDRGPIEVHIDQVWLA